MGENGPCLPLRRSWTHTVTIPSRKSYRPSTVSWKAIFGFSGGSPYRIIALMALLLSCWQSAVLATPIECPALCLCSNTTNASSINVLSIDCSSGGLHSFLNNLPHQVDTAVNDSQSTHEVNGTSTSIPRANASETDLVLELQPNGNRIAQDRTSSFIDNSMGPNVNRENANIHATPMPDINLDLSFNNLSSLQAFDLLLWDAAPLVKQLNLSNNLMESFNTSSLQVFVNLVSLDLSDNTIGIFSLDASLHLSSLKYLYLSHNKIVNIEVSGHNSPSMLPNLVHLDLSHNALLELSRETFSAFPDLTSLNLTGNKIEHISPSAFVGLPRLQLLSLSHNNIHSLDYPVFQNTSLTQLLLDNLPRLSQINYAAFKGLQYLQYLNLSHNTELTFLHPLILSGLSSLQVLDISGSGVQLLSPLTFQNVPQLQTVYLQDIPFKCECTNAWLVEEMNKSTSIFPNASSFRCQDVLTNQIVTLADAVFPCSRILLENMTSEFAVPIGSPLMLQCQQHSSSGGGILTWTTPRGHVFYLHNFNSNASQHLWSPKDMQLDAPFHKNHYWHQSSSYYSDLSSNSERMQILSDGSLFIDYMLRTDTGTYVCMVENAHYNSSGKVGVQLIYKVSGEVKIIACIVGLLCALGFFALSIVYVIITWLARKLVNKRRREHVSRLLENLNSYKSTHITRIYENYTGQLNRVRNRYHTQRDRLHRNYTMQVDRVKRGCSHQVEKVRENYNSKLTQLREYSSNQIVQIRDITNTQIGRIRDYGSLQLDRLRETYKFQHQHMMKLLDTLNLDNCRTIVETECMRTESMMYDLDLLSQEGDRTESPFSLGDSEYNTAASSPLMGGDPNDLNQKKESQNRKSIDSFTKVNLVISSSNESVYDDGIQISTTEDDDAKSKPITNKDTGDDVKIEMTTMSGLQDAREDQEKVKMHQNTMSEDSSPQHFLYNDDDDDDFNHTDHLYDADEEEEEEERSERDSMV